MKSQREYALIQALKNMKDNGEEVPVLKKRKRNARKEKEDSSKA